MIETESGKWVNSFVYDDSTVVQYPLNADGSIGEAADVIDCGHGVDPNSSPQGGFHAQASPHAHIVSWTLREIPGGLRKGGRADLRLSPRRRKLVLASVYQCPREPVRAMLPLIRTQAACS